MEVKVSKPKYGGFDVWVPQWEVCVKKKMYCKFQARWNACKILYESKLSVHKRRGLEKMITELEIDKERQLVILKHNKQLQKEVSHKRSAEHGGSPRATKKRMGT